MDKNNSRDAICAAQFCECIREIAQKPENLENLEAYLSRHFTEWMKKYANTPENLVYEMQGFSI